MRPLVQDMTKINDILSDGPTGNTTGAFVSSYYVGLVPIHLSFVEFIVTGFKSNRTSKTNNQNPFECILTTNKTRFNGI